MGPNAPPYRSRGQSRKRLRSRRFYDPRFLFAAAFAVLAVAIAASQVDPPHEVLVTCAPAPGPVLQCRSITRNVFGLRAEQNGRVTADAGRGGALDLAPRPLETSFQDVDAGFEAEGSLSRVRLRFGFSQGHALTPWLPTPEGGADLTSFEEALRRGQRATFAYETGWKGLFPPLYLTVLGLLVSAALSGWARVSFDPEAPMPEVEVETKPAWFRSSKRERIPLEDIEAVRMLKVVPRKGATYWQVALIRRGREPVPIGVPLGLAGAKRWHRHLTQLVDPSSDFPPPPSSSA